ncbi:MAG TPA: UPF0182 family protein [Gemmatimonadaceae bacterium]|nr:UPF0182 family protein [Gemmatimonadaceae bacterium]
MTPRRRLIAGLLAAAAFLLVGRVTALAYSDYAWHSALGASALWRERARDVFVIHMISAVFAGLFALVNLSAIRRSIVSLAFPRRLGNVEFGEAVPQRNLDRAAFLLSAIVAGMMSLVVPPWEQLALVRASPRFGESDPFFRLDLSFYTTWLPLERSVYDWTLVLLTAVSAIVIGLYALTPSLRWHRGAFHVSAHVRRHLAVLAMLFLIMMAWSHRLDGYELLVNGSGEGGAFSYIDHKWLIPAYLALSVGTVAAAALVLFAGWTAQIRTIFFTISAVLIFSVTLDLVLPSVASRFAGSVAASTRDAPYQATRVAFTRRAYGLPQRGSPGTPDEVRRFDSFADSSRLARLVETARDSTLVYPGALGAALVKGGRGIAAPVLGSGFRRVAHAWSEQRLDIAWSAHAPDSRISRRRDVTERLATLLPVFTQGSRIAPAYLGDTLVWVVELYSASSTYPLSRHYRLAGDVRSYFRHSGTAITNSETGRVVVVPDPNADPIAIAWRERFPSIYRAGGTDLLDELGPTPRDQPALIPVIPRPATDSAFRAEVLRLYARMRSALASGNLSAFSAAYDSLGAVIGR